MTFAVPVLCVLLAWWAGTGVILYLDGLPRRTYARSFAAASALLLAACAGLAAGAARADVSGAYLAFGSALTIWAWLEMALLFGYVTGPRKVPCDPSAAGWRRFRQALDALRHHELALCAGAVLVVTLAWDAPNQVGTWTYLVLWIMRTSAKLNLFLGVRNLGENLLPPHLGHLASYFRRAPMNAFFPIAITAATAVAAFVLRAAAATSASDFDVTAALLCGTLLCLALLEHWCMVLPLPIEALWRWASAARPRGKAAAAASDRPAVRLDLVAPLKPLQPPRLALVTVARPDADGDETRRR